MASKNKRLAAPRIGIKTPVAPGQQPPAAPTSSAAAPTCSPAPRNMRLARLANRLPAQTPFVPAKPLATSSRCRMHRYALSAVPLALYSASSSAAVITMSPAIRSGPTI